MNIDRSSNIRFRPEQAKSVWQAKAKALSVGETWSPIAAIKVMFLRCAVFGTVCLPIFALIDMGMTIIAPAFVRVRTPDVSAHSGDIVWKYRTSVSRVLSIT